MLLILHDLVQLNSQLKSIKITLPKHLGEKEKKGDDPHRLTDWWIEFGHGQNCFGDSRRHGD